MRGGLLLMTLGLTAGMASCAGPRTDSPPASEIPPARGPETNAEVTLPAARLPTPAGSFAPSRMRLGVAGSEVSVEMLADVEICADCHADVAAQWRGSAHAHASFDNPWYRTTIDAYREEVGREQSRFCAGCHDPLLLLSGKMESEIRPEDPLAFAGITCMVCHGITETSTDGNGSYVLAPAAEVPMPRRGDAQSLEAHKAAVALDPLREVRLCAGCHRAFLDTSTGNAHFLPGTDELGPWAASPYAGSTAERVDEPLPERRCHDCHMPEERTTLRDAAAPTGSVRSHRFFGGQTAIASMDRDPERLDQNRAHLLRAATIDVAALSTDNGVSFRPADGASLADAGRITFDVVIRNVGAGHRFPGGVRDTQDTWVELTLADAAGQPIAEAGTRHERVSDPTAHRLITQVVDGEGNPELVRRVHLFRTAAYDHTIPARDAQAVRYEASLPTDLPRAAFPLRVEARLLHRRHLRELAELACEGSRSRRGRAFMAKSRALGRDVLDGCAEQPVSEIARAVIWIGRGAGTRSAEGGAARPSWARLFDHALALSHDVQERLDDARPSVSRALELVESEPTGHVPAARARAMLLSLRAQLDGRQGRLEDAMSTVAMAEELIGEHPALWRTRGRALARVWRWPEAAEAFRRVAELTPRDTMAWRELARARGSAGDDAGALIAAEEGLARLPRDEDLLRSQALAIAHLGLPLAEEARSAFLSHRRPDDASDVRLACERNVALCHRDRQPVPLIVMRSVR